MKRSMKKGLAVMLSAAMLASSGGVSGLTSLAGLMYGGNVDSTYYRVKLHAGVGGKFTSPQEFVWDDGEDEDVATPSQLSKATPSEVPKATPSNATSWSIQGAKDKNSKISEFAVDDNKLTLEDVTQAATEAGIDPSDVLWLTKENDLNTQFPEKGLTLTKGNIKDLYAVHKVESEKHTNKVESVESFNAEGAWLIVNELAAEEQLTTEDALKNAVEAAGIKDAKGLNVEDLIQLDIKPNEVKYNNSKFIIRLTLPWDFLEKIRPGKGKDFFVLHKHDNKWTEVTKKWYGDSQNTIEFTLDKFSPVVIGIKDAKPVMVTLKNVDNGAGVVFAKSNDPETGKEIRTYIPIGVPVPVPTGTKLRLNATSVGNFSYAFKVQEEGGEPELVEASSITVGDKNITIIPEFTPGKEEDNDDSYIVIKNKNLSADNKVTGELKVHYKEKYIDVTNWQFELPDKEWELQEIKNDLFNLDKDGHLSSKDKLEPGSYRLYVSYEHNGKRLKDDAWINVGFDVWFGVSLGKFKNGRHAEWHVGSSPYYLNETDFSKICQDTEMNYEIALFGNFTWAKWYDENGVKLTGKINSYTSAYAIILDAEGKTYQPTIGNSQTKPDDNPDDKPVRPSTGGSSSGGSSDGSMNLNVLVGSWKKDDKGWWYQLRDGSYAKDRWGIIGGSWYYFGSDGYMKTGWLYWKDGWYYLTAADGKDIGKMKTGWFYDEALGDWFYLNNSDGKMETGWKQIGSIWYYFNPNSDGRRGAMESNKWIGNYFLGTTGAWDKDMAQ